MSDSTRLAAIFKALSVESRVRMVRLLHDHQLCVNALARRLGISAAAVSQHLRVLREAGLVAPERRGLHMHYRVNAEALRQCDELLHHLMTPRKIALERYIPGQERAEGRPPSFPPGICANASARARPSRG